MSWLLVPALVGAAVLFVVNSICWMVLQHHMSDFKPTPGRDAVEAALKHVPPGGFYCLPHMTDFAGGFKDPALAKRWASGPNATIVVHTPTSPMGPSTFLRGFLLNLVESISLVCVLHAFGVTDLLHAAAYGAMLGALVRGVGPLNQAIWMNFPWAPAVKVILDGAAGWAVAALVIRLVG